MDVSRRSRAQDGGQEERTNSAVAGRRVLPEQRRQLVQLVDGVGERDVEVLWPLIRRARTAEGG